MRILTASLGILLMTVACGKDTYDKDPCARAVANAERLVRENPLARAEYGDVPLSLEQCRRVRSPQQVACMGYASSWVELEDCSANLLQSSR